jgi:hypothetical protein
MGRFHRHADGVVHSHDEAIGDHSPLRDGP